ncbi:MAG: vWA domain-containing protein [Polyangiaceae bacterium]
MALSLPRLSALALLALGALASGCGGPVLANDGTMVFQQGGAHGASVITANGVEFHDSADVPPRIVHRDANDPWRAPVGFILPANKRFTKTSHPTILASRGVAISIRPSDTRVPSWGGEVLMRIDLIAPAAEGTARRGERIAIILDGNGDETHALAQAAFAQLASRDRVVVFDAGQVVVPLIPASHRSLALAAIDKYLSEPVPKADLQQSLIKADAALALAIPNDKPEMKRVVIFTDGQGQVTPAVKTVIDKMAGDGIPVSVIAAQDGARASKIAEVAMMGGGVVGMARELDARIGSVKQALPPAGALDFEDMTLTFEGVPAPSHVVEASGGDVVWRLDAGELDLGDMHSGEARTEVVRVTVPPFVPGEPFRFAVTARYRSMLEDGQPERVMRAGIPCTYDDNIERIANSRHGDVIAYASALATLRRLDEAFVGVGVQNAGGLLALAKLHARSMTALARDTKDPAIAEQAEILNALLSVER